MSTATVTMPRLPSLAEMEQQMKERLPGLTIYNPTDQWVQLEVYGLTHLWACPDLGGAVEPHPITAVPTKCDGRSTIRGRFLHQKDSSGKNIEGQDASSMMKYLVSPENYGQMGFVWLPGISPADDLRLIDTSKKVFAGFQRSTDEMIVSRRAEFKSNWEKSGTHKGQPCPPPTSAESAAMDRLQERKRSTTFRYNCEHADCPGYAVNDWDKFARHMKVAHDLEPKREQFDGEVGGLKSEPASSPSQVNTSSPTSSIRMAAEAIMEVEASGEAEAVAERGVEPEADRPLPKPRPSSRR